MMIVKSICLFLTFYLLSLQSVWAVQVAFFRQYTPSGNLVVYESGGEFAHIAISYRGQWLHAHPYGGVQLSKDIHSVGFLDFVILENPTLPEPDSRFVQAQLQKKFDVFASWTDPMRTYCSKLIAQFFGVRPRVMSFSSKDWVGLNPPRGQLGLSPDDLYRELINQRGFSLRMQPLMPLEVISEQTGFQKRRCVRFLNL